MKALLYTSDPYEPSGVIGLFETEEQKEKIISDYLAQSKYYMREDLREIDIPIGVFGFYW